MGRGQVTHILLRYRKTDPPATVLIRMSDGMCIGSAQGSTVTLGTDPRRPDEIHSFLDETWALTYLRKAADKEVALLHNSDEYAAVFEERDGETRIIMDGNLSMQRRPS